MNAFVVFTHGFLLKPLQNFYFSKEYIILENLFWNV